MFSALYEEEEICAVLSTCPIVEEWAYLGDQTLEIGFCGVDMMKEMKPFPTL
jgi:hypothetical protein